MLSQTITYLPQSAYEDGGLMCTAVATQWSIRCLGGMQPMCTDRQMDTIMCRGRDIHVQTCSCLRGPAAAPFMLKQDEVLDNMVLPDGLTRTEIFVAASEKHLPPDVPNLIGLPWLPARITPRSGMLFTAHGHTLAVFCDAADNIFVFDSAVAYVRRVSRDELVMVLDTVHRTVQTFAFNSTATLLSFDVAAPSDKESKFEDVLELPDGTYSTTFNDAYDQISSLEFACDVNMAADSYGTLLNVDVAAPSPPAENALTIENVRELPGVSSPELAGNVNMAAPIIIIDDTDDDAGAVSDLNLGSRVPQAHSLNEAHVDNDTTAVSTMEGFDQQDRSCNDLCKYLDAIKKKNGTVAMMTRKGTELRYSHTATVNMFKKPDGKLRGVIRADDPALIQQGIRDNLVALVPTKDGVTKAAEHYCGCDRVKKSSAGLFHYLRDCLDFCEHGRFRKSCYQCAPHNFCPAGRMHRNGNRKRKSQCDKKCCASAKISKH